MIWFDSSSIFWVDRVAPVKKRWTLKALAEWALTFGRSALAAGIYIHEANWWHNEERTHEPTDFEPRDLGSIFLWFTNTKDADRSKNRLWDNQNHRQVLVRDGSDWVISMDSMGFVFLRLVNSGRKVSFLIVPVGIPYLPNWPPEGQYDCRSASCLQDVWCLDSRW